MRHVTGDFRQFDPYKALAYSIHMSVIYIYMISDLLGAIKDAEVRAAKIIADAHIKVAKIVSDSEIEIKKINDDAENQIARASINNEQVTIDDNSETPKIEIPKTNIDKAIKYITAEFAKRYK